MIYQEMLRQCRYPSCITPAPQLCHYPSCPPPLQCHAGAGIYLAGRLGLSGGWSFRQLVGKSVGQSGDSISKGAMLLDPCHTGQANTDVRTDLLWSGTTSNLTQARPASDFSKYVPPAGEHRHLKTGFEKSDF